MSCTAATRCARATNVLTVANDIADRLGAKPLRAAIASLAVRARLDVAAPETGTAIATDTADDAAPTAPPAADPFGLTRRELEVLALVAAGRTNRQIADALFISESTAGVHVSNILGKLGVAGRTEAAGVAIRLGLVPA